MKSLRPLLTAVLGLALLVQGVAVAASPQKLAGMAGATAPAQSAMPCHHHAIDAAQAPACDCGDQDCPDMSGCAFGHMAAVLPAAGLHFVAARQVVVVTPDRFAESVALPSHLRPPILALL